MQYRQGQRHAIHLQGSKYLLQCIFFFYLIIGLWLHITLAVMLNECQSSTQFKPLTKLSFLHHINWIHIECMTFFD